MFDLQGYDVTKKWVIIAEISKEVENNSIPRINAYARQYVRSVRGGESARRTGNGGPGGSY
jgi:homoserine dehydrogenase